MVVGMPVGMEDGGRGEVEGPAEDRPIQRWMYWLNYTKIAPAAKKQRANRSQPFDLLVGRARFELATNGLKVRCSTG
jgi:hypothetical protein